jgi:hypothetical protein
METSSAALAAPFHAERSRAGSSGGHARDFRIAADAGVSNRAEMLS